MVSPVLHSNEPVASVDKVAVPQLFVILTTGADSVFILSAALAEVTGELQALLMVTE